MIDEVTLGNDVNEDSWGASGSIAWILDGSSSVSPERVAPLWATDARWLVDRLEASLRSLADRHDMSLRNVLATAISSAATSAEEDWDHQPEVPPSAAIALVRKLEYGLEYLVLADVSVILDDRGSLVEITDQRVDEGNVVAFEALKNGLAINPSLAEVRRNIAPLLHDYRRKSMNREGGYFVVSIDPTVVDEGVDGMSTTADEIILATDGFMRCMRPFHFLAGLHDLLDHPGALPDIAMRVREEELRDPEAVEYPRWNTSDDLCAVRLRWTGQNPESSVTP